MGVTPRIDPLPPEEWSDLLRTATNCNCEYEWAQHLPLGLQAGLTEEEIEAVRLPIGDHDWSYADALLLAAVDELDASCNLSDDTWNTLSERYDERQMIEFPMLVGHYKMVAGALNSLRVQIESAGP